MTQKTKVVGNMEEEKERRRFHEKSMGIRKSGVIGERITAHMAWGY